MPHVRKAAVAPAPAKPFGNRIKLLHRTDQGKTPTKKAAGRGVPAASCVATIGGWGAQVIVASEAHGAPARNASKAVPNIDTTPSDTPHSCLRRALRAGKP